MSSGTPNFSITMVFGEVSVPQADVVTCRIHLGGTKEVSSFEVLLQNWGKKYSPNGWLPIIIGSLGGIGLSRDPINPSLVPVISLKVEKLEYQDTPCESYVKVSGRCWGEKLFRRVVTKTYENVKGEAIVVDLLDNYVGLNHTRNAVELVEDTDTTYTKLEYQDTPVWDILTFVAKTADKNGVIGFDFRVAPDGKFEFFPKNSKTNSVSLSEKIESATYSKDIFGVRNRVTIYGAPEKCIPENKDDWTTILSPTAGVWSAEGQNAAVAQDNTKSVLGEGSVKCNINNGWYGKIIFTFNAGYEIDANLYPTLNLFLQIGSTLAGKGGIGLEDTTGRLMFAGQGFKNDGTNWLNVQLGVGSKHEDKWVPGAGQTDFDWAHIKKVTISVIAKDDLTPGSGDFWTDALYFTGRRFSATVQDVTSQVAYTEGEPREYSDIDEELYSDNECGARANAILAQLKDPAESLTISSTVIDYGTTPLLACDNIAVVLPNENVDANFRVDSAEYEVDAKVQELTLTLELGRVAPLLADWVYALRSKVNQVNRYKISK